MCWQSLPSWRASLGTFDDPAYADPGKRKANVFDFRLEGESAKKVGSARGSPGFELEW